MTKVLKRRYIVYSTIVLLVAVLGIGANINVDVDNPFSPKGSTIGNFITVTIGTDQAYAAGTPDYTCDGVDDDVQFQAALNALPATGGALEVLGGTYVFANATSVTRAIDNVTVTGVGRGTYFSGDGVTALWICGGNNWKFQDCRTDAGSITVGATTGWQMINVDLNGTLYSFRDPYVSMTGGTMNTTAITTGGKLTAAANEIEGSNFDINGGDISAGTVSGGLTWSAAQDLNSQNLTNVNIDSGTINDTNITVDAGDTLNTTGGTLTTGATQDVGESKDDGEWHVYTPTSAMSPSADIGTNYAITDGANDYVDIQEAIDAMSAAGGGWVVLHEGTYVLGSSGNADIVELESGVNIRGQGYSTLVQYDSNNGFAFGDGGDAVSDIVIEGIRFECTDQSNERNAVQVGLEGNADTAVRITVRDCEFDGTGINIRTLRGTGNGQNQVLNNYIHDRDDWTNWHGAINLYGDDSLADGNIIRNCANAGILGQGVNWTATNNTIVNVGYADNTFAIDSGRAENVNITGNNIETRNGINTENCAGAYNISGNSIVETYRITPSYFKYSDNGAYTDLTNAFDGDPSTSITLADFVAAQDYLLIGYSQEFCRIYVDMGTANDAIATISAVETSDGGAGWNAEVLGNDGTLAGGTDTLGQDGLITTCTNITNWASDTVDGDTALWTRLTLSADPDDGITINEITIGGFENSRGIALQRTAADEPFATSMSVNSNDIFGFGKAIDVEDEDLVSIVGNTITSANWYAIYATKDLGTDPTSIVIDSNDILNACVGYDNARTINIANSMDYVFIINNDIERTTWNVDGGGLAPIAIRGVQANSEITGNRVTGFGNLVMNSIDEDCKLDQYVIPFSIGYDTSAGTMEGAITASGWDIDEAGDYAYAFGVTPVDVDRVVRIKIFGRAQVASDPSMELDITLNAGADNEQYNAEAVSVASHASESGVAGNNDVIYWLCVAGDDTDIDEIGAAEYLQIQVDFAAADGGSEATDLAVGCAIIEYI